MNEKRYLWFHEPIIETLMENCQFVIMEDLLDFEQFLFGDGNEIKINDIEFCVDRIIMLPQIRPHKLEMAVRLSIDYCQISDFRLRMVEKIEKCPVLIYRLFKRGILSFEEIKPFLNKECTFLLGYYFRKEIDDFDNYISEKSMPWSYERSLFQNENDIDQLIEYGFLPSSIEYCLKYDDVDNLLHFNNLQIMKKISPFEWSLKENLDILSFSGYFGSIKCFRHLLMKGFKINNGVISKVVCSGCFDLFHLCQGQQSLTIDCVFSASQFCHLTMLTFMIENGVDINQKGSHVEFVYFVQLLFIMQLLMVILVLLNIFIIIMLT